VSRHHRIDYIEFGVTDILEAKRFYGEAFGWIFNEYGPGYAGIVDGEGEMGGLALADEVTTGGVLCVLWSDELEASKNAVLNAGGTIAKDIFSFPGGRRFEFLDPSGNRVAIWSSPA
jgi:predicted enzyme related to lactoylglutathione lyase